MNTGRLQLMTWMVARVDDEEGGIGSSPSRACKRESIA